MKERIERLEKRLEGALPEDYEERFETHEELYELFERAWGRADAVAHDAIKLLKEVEGDER